MLYGLLTYESQGGRYNLGDYVQSLSARRYLPRVDAFISRERLAEYSGPPIKLIMNGWFTHNASNWVPSRRITPLFVSFHVNTSAAHQMLSPSGISYLKEHSPIGCRDHNTVRLLQSFGIEAYFSGCLTLTLVANRPRGARSTENLLVDPFFNLPSPAKSLRSISAFVRSLREAEYMRWNLARNLMGRIFTSEFRGCMSRVTQEFEACGETEAEKFAKAQSYLERYAAARVVVTSRIHCALPCLALGTPVLFLNAFTDEIDTCRFEGLLGLFNRIDVAPDGRISSSFGTSVPVGENDIPQNMGKHRALADQLAARCAQFVSG